MSIPTIQQDKQQLGSQSLLSDYQRNKNDLILLAKHVYQTAASLLGSVSQPNEIEEALTTTLFRDGIFAKIVNSKPHIPPVLYLGYAESMARVLLDEEWREIQRSP
ncbi:MAG TPA: hypothetical protein VIX59_02550 [Candidatus Binataceae bacterium]